MKIRQTRHTYRKTGKQENTKFVFYTKIFVRVTKTTFTAKTKQKKIFLKQEKILHFVKV